MRIPRLLIAGTESGVGKTTVCLGLLKGLIDRGLAVSPFKVGPDYIDPGYLSAVAQRPCRNLDTWLIPRGRLIRLFQKACFKADMALVEGVMGLYDGIGSISEAGSSAYLAKLLQTPVLLVVDAHSLSRSAVAMVKGFRDFDPQVNIAGVFLNRVSGEGHYRLIKEGIERLLKVPVVGYLPKEEALKLPERHLGLVPSVEIQGVKRILKDLRTRVRQGVNLDLVERIARNAPVLALEDHRGKEEVPGSPPKRGVQRIPIGVALDEAFHFYYPENLELLEELGGEVIPFSPLKDPHIPEGLAALYLGGGFPEVFAQPLSRNRSLQAQIRHAVYKGLPTYAECGGLMFLSESITDTQGRSYPMVGVVPGRVTMTHSLQNFGYKRLQARRATVLARPGERARGHEFHHSLIRGIPERSSAAYEVFPTLGERSRWEGYSSRNLLASYIHLHFFSQPRWAHRFIQAARDFKEGKARQSVKVLQVKAGKPVTCL